MEKYQCILLAAGEGQRANLGYNKVLYKIRDKKEIMLYSVDFFIKDENCEKIVLVINERDKGYISNLLESLNTNKIEITIGGDTRGASVSSGLKLITSDYVLIHDSARPLIYVEDVRNLLLTTKETSAAALATKVYNTTCHMSDGYIDEYFSRHELASIITPQCFKTESLKEAYKKAEEQNITFTDDSGIFKKFAGNVKLVFTDNLSIKATTSYDIKLLEVILYASW